MAVIFTFQGGEATYASTRRTFTRIDHIAAPADMLARLRLSRVLVRTEIRLQLVRSTQRCDHSPVIAVFQRDSWKEKSRNEPAWSAEASNACWMTGWKRPEVIGALEEALQEKKAEFDRLVDSEKTPDSINDIFMETVKEAVQPSLAARPKDEEEWVTRS